MTAYYARLISADGLETIEHIPVPPPPYIRRPIPPPRHTVMAQVDDDYMLQIQVREYGYEGERQELPGAEIMVYREVRS